VSTKQNTNFDELQEILGYRFNNIAYLTRALTHSSYANEQKLLKSQSNERMEFLGDSVLSVIVSEKIFFDYPQLPEGVLSRIRAGSVCEKALGEYATKINLGSYMYLGKGEEIIGGRGRVSLLADCFEAVLAAMFLDGGIEPARKFVLPFVSEEIENIFKSGHTEDYKTMLQHFVQQEHNDILEYMVVDITGPDHDRLFKVEAKLNGNVIGKGTGKSKREAEQNAAKEALILFDAFEKNE